MISVANAALWLLGRKIVPDYIGYWYLRDGKICRELSPIGWRIAKLSEPERTSALDRMWWLSVEEAIKKRDAED